MGGATQETLPKLPPQRGAEGEDRTPPEALDAEVAKWCPAPEAIENTFRIARERFAAAAAAAWLRGWFNTFRDLIRNTVKSPEARLKLLDAIAKTFGTPKILTGGLRSNTYLRTQIDEIKADTGVDIEPMYAVLMALADPKEQEGDA